MPRSLLQEHAQPPGAQSCPWLGRVREVGAVHEREVISELYLNAKRLVQNVSSIAGLAQAGAFPLGKLRSRRRGPPHEE